MQRIPTLLQKLEELSKKGEQINVIDIDLMLDYTKVLYADLLEWRKRAVYTGGELPKTEEKQQEPAPQVKQDEPVSVSEPKIDETPKPQPEHIISPTQQDNIVQEEPVTETESIEAKEILEKPIAEQPTIAFEEKKPIQDKQLKKVIGINDKYQYISELFGNDKEAYDHMVDHISTLDNHQTAISYIDNELAPQRGWDKDSITVQSLHDNVWKYFYSS